MTKPLEFRSVCATCGRPSVVCLCAYVTRLETRTRVVILQHPRERNVPIGTARLAELGLPRSMRLVGVDFASSPELERALSDPEAPAIVLFPGPDAKALTELEPGARRTLVVLDGTWSQAEKIMKTNPRLRALERYQLSPSEPSRYRIRRAPAFECISTVEAIAQALTLLEGPGTDVRPLLAPFDALVGQQLAFKRERAESRHMKRPRPSRAPRVPVLPVGAHADLVLVYGEANGWPRRSPYGENPELVHLAAERLTTGERFSRFIAPGDPLAPSFEKHTGISRERVQQGLGRAEFLARFQEFLGPSSVLGVWGHFTLQALRREQPDSTHFAGALDFRSVLRNFLKRSPGDVESAARLLNEARALEEPWAEGRTGTRLTALAGVARALIGMVHQTPNSS